MIILQYELPVAVPRLTRNNYYVSMNTHNITLMLIVIYDSCNIVYVITLFTIVINSTLSLGKMDTSKSEEQMSTNVKLPILKPKQFRNIPKNDSRRLSSDSRDTYNCALICAVKNNNMPMVKRLLLTFTPYSEFDMKSHIDTPCGKALVYAIQNNNIEMIKQLLMAAVVCTGDTCRNVLEYAVQNDNIGLIDMLSSICGEDVYEDALTCSAKLNKIGMVERLLSARVEDYNGYALKYAVKNGNMDMFYMLTTAGSKVERGHALEQAVKTNNVEIFNRLMTVTKRSDVSYGYALEYAARNNNTIMFDRLLLDGAKDTYGYALEYATVNDNILMVNSLLPVDTNRKIVTENRHVERSGRYKLCGGDSCLPLSSLFTMLFVVLMCYYFVL